MSTERNTSVTLKLSICASMAIVILGAALFFAGLGTDVLWFGILFLILSPFIGIIVTTVSLYLEKDMKWVTVALILIIVSIIGLLIK